MNKKIFFIVIFILILFSCVSRNPEDKNHGTSLNNESIEEDIKIKYVLETRDAILLQLENKIKKDEPLIIHAFVALYGYDSTNISEVEKWADGTNLITNLYWGAGYGIKTHFKKRNNWKLLFEQKNINDDILERVVFYKTFPNKAKVYLIADAYKGYRMRKCLIDYFNALAENKLDSVKLKNKIIPGYGNSDLIAFNGHNGLMDFDIEFNVNLPTRKKDAIAIACTSEMFFNELFERCYAYPLLTTRGLIPAEGYILSSTIESWAMLQTGGEIKVNTIKTYCSIQKIDYSEAESLFTSGWY